MYKDQIFQWLPIDWGIKSIFFIMIFKGHHDLASSYLPELVFEMPPFCLLRLATLASLPLKTLNSFSFSLSLECISFGLFLMDISHLLHIKAKVTSFEEPSPAPHPKVDPQSHLPSYCLALTCDFPLCYLPELICFFIWLLLVFPFQDIKSVEVGTPDILLIVVFSW